MRTITDRLGQGDDRFGVKLVIEGLSFLQGLVPFFFSNLLFSELLGIASRILAGSDAEIVENYLLEMLLLNGCIDFALICQPKGGQHYSGIGNHSVNGSLLC